MYVCVSVCNFDPLQSSLLSLFGVPLAHFGIPLALCGS
jgi:hypothetical protein